MKTSVASFSIVGFFAAATLLHAQNLLSPRSGATAFDNVVDFSYSGRAKIGEGTRLLGEIDSVQFRSTVITATSIDAHATLQAGFSAQWLEFHPPAGSIVPEHLGALSLKLGLNHSFDSRWSARVEIDPGLYGDFSGAGGNGFDAPMALRLVYAASQELQWVVGLNADWRSGHPLTGGVGVRWQFAPDWTLAFLLPAPRVEWTVARNIALFAGASIQGGTFRVADNFGRTRGRPALDGQIVDYRELSVGLGVRWQVSPMTALNLGAGQMLDRRFEFHERNLPAQRRRGTDASG